MKLFKYLTASRKVAGDLLTPVTAYLNVRDLYSQSVLMESSDYHGVENSKSFIAINPIATVSIAHGVGTMLLPDGTTQEHAISADYDAARLINEFLGHFSIAVRYFENISIKDETQKENDAADMQYTLFKSIAVFDHYSNELTLIELVAEGEKSSLDKFEHSLSSHTFRTFGFRAVGDCTSTLTDDEHRENIRRGIAHCKRGDVFQIVLSRRFKQSYTGDDFQLYRALRSNPSPYLFYFDFGGFRIFGSSPETHCRIQGRQAYIDPIAGTTRRTGNAEQDRENALYLKNDPKENAEHVMLVDLARNDLSRNCHNVHIDFYKDMQYYSHVIHLVSRVSGELDNDADPVKAFIDTFPAGTLSGAPKVRAMQLISEYEPHNRGAYGGCIGFIGFNGDLNQAITIRTFVSRNGELWFQAGGGIVAKSDVEYELQEVNNKLGALRKAIQMAEKL